MTRAEFIKLLATKCPELLFSDTDRGVRAIIEELTVALSEDKRIEIRNFGCFTTKTSEARIGINPRTGEKTEFASHKVVRFKSGRNFKELLNKDQSKTQEQEPEQIPNKE